MNTLKPRIPETMKQTFTTLACRHMIIAMIMNMNTTMVTVTIMTITTMTILITPQIHTLEMKEHHIVQLQ